MRPPRQRPAAWRRATAAVLALLTGAAVAAPVSVRDDAGQTLTLAAPARRIVSLGPHLAELVAAAGGVDRLVGVMRYSDHPPEVTRLPMVGDAFALNLELIAALKPELLLVWRSGINPRQQQRLEGLGLPVFGSEITDIAGLADTLRRLGRLMGTEPVAEAAARQVEDRWQALRRQYAGRAPVRVFYQLWHEPLMTVNRGHLIDQAITACGGINIFGGQPTLTPTVSWEAAIAANPQLVITGASRDEPARLERWQRFEQVEAVRRRQVIALDEPQLGRMTPRFLEAAQALCEAIDRARRAQAATQ